MKKIAFLLIGLLVLAAIAAAVLYLRQPHAPQFQPEEGYTFLYDGESLDGWRVIGGGAAFAADGEAIVGRHGEGENTFLRTAKTYGDFSLKLQMRWDEPGNSGVLFRAQQRNGNGRAFGYQYELDSSKRAFSGGIYDEARRRWLADLQENPEARAAIRLDAWNDVEIEARGVSLKTWINGVPAADIVDGLDARGFIALQVHAGNAGVMRWRRIRIRELPVELARGASLLSAVEWTNDKSATLQFSGNGFSAPLPAEGVWLTPRRQFSDALLRMTVPACDQPTIVRMRYVEAAADVAASFAEVKIYADRAEGRLVTATGEQLLAPVKLHAAQTHQFTGLTLGDDIVLSVDEVDVLRLKSNGLRTRGQLRIHPARCGEQFTVADLAWFTFRGEVAEPLFYQTLDTPPAPVLSPQEALQAFRIAPGFDIELVAAEPLVEDPVAMAWDAYGRLYVVELRGYMPDAYGTDSEAPVGQVVRLEDRDGDGAMDTSEVFLGGLVSPRAVAVVNEGVLIGEPPNLWLCATPTRDALCESKLRVGSYGSDDPAANVEHMENGLRQGLDNWLYNSKSARRLRLQGGELEEQEGLFRGQWGITKDNYGRLLYNHNSTWIQADLFAAEDLLIPGVKGSPQGLGVNLTNPPEVFSVRVNPGVNRAYLDNTLRPDGRLHQATGVSGLVSYRGDQFPMRYREDVFVPEAAANVVAQFAMSQDGMTLTATQRLYPDDTWGQRDFLASTDERFRPVDAMNGPDGALYIIDMYRGIIQDDHFLTDQLREQIFQRGLEQPLGHGRIWRVRHREGKPERDMVQLAEASDVRLLAALADDNGWVRDTAQRLLLGRGGKHQAALLEIALGEDTIAALHAIWTLRGRGELQREQVLAITGVADIQRQMQALRAGTALLRIEDLLALHVAWVDAAPALNRQLALSLGQHVGDARARAALVTLLTAHLDNTFVRQAVVRAATGEELLFLREYLGNNSLPVASEVGRSVLLALTGGAYRTLRGDLTSAQPANPALLELLALVESRRDDAAWQQRAMLRGLTLETRKKDFVPASLTTAPALFSDTSITEQNPLWKARLAGRAAFTWPGDELALGITPLSPGQLQLMALGEAFYAACAACHGADGAGTAGLAPPLAGASWVTGPPEWLARIVLQGMSGPIEVLGEQWNGVMPAHGHLPELDDATLAGLLMYLRRSWGNKADPVSVAMVAAVRAAIGQRNTPWSAAELAAVAVDRGYQRFVGKYEVSFITLTVSEAADGLHYSVPMYGSGRMTPVSATIFEVASGDERVQLEFVIEEDGSVNRLLLYRDGEKIPVIRKPE